MSPAQLSLLGYVEIQFDILKMIDRGNGMDSRKNSISSLKNLSDSWAVSAFLEKTKLY